MGSSAQASLGAGPASLTRQQWAVASLAASGWTNRRIADHLCLSQRTIAAHLRQVFPKLGITRRASLRDALTAEEMPRSAAHVWPAASLPAAKSSDRVPLDRIGWDIIITARDLEIALLAASGLTNKQIAGRLYLSHRTVGASLYRIFPKLGIASRAALRDALAPVMSTAVGLS